MNRQERKRLVRQLRADGNRHTTNEILQIVPTKWKTVQEWVKDIDQAYEKKVGKYVRRRYSDGATLDEIAHKFKLDPGRVKALLAGLIEDEVEKLKTWLSENPKIDIHKLKELFPRWSERTIYYYIRQFSNEVEGETYEDSSGEKYFTALGLSKYFGLSILTITIAVYGTEDKVRRLQLRQAGKTRPQFFYSVKDLLTEHPHYRRFRKIQTTVEQNPNGILLQLPHNLCLSSWVVLLAFLIFRIQKKTCPNVRELHKIIKDTYQYSLKTIQNSLEELVRTGYLVKKGDELYASPQCPVDLITRPSKKVVECIGETREYHDFVVSPDRLRVVTSMNKGGKSKNIDTVRQRYKRKKTVRRGRKKSL